MSAPTAKHRETEKLRRAGLLPRHRTLLARRRAREGRLYRRGWTLREIETLLGVSRQTVLLDLRCMGVERRAPGKRRSS